MSLSSALADLDAAYAAGRKVDECVWPSRYRSISGLGPFVAAGRVRSDAALHPDHLCAKAFLYECCWTYNEADGSVELIPHHNYIDWFVNEWLWNRAVGGTLICEKSRRLIMSWVCRGLELWSLGLRREKVVICGLNYTKSAEHVWRIAWYWRELRKRRPEFGLADCSTRGGNFGAQEIEQVILPNGSLIENLNQAGYLTYFLNDQQNQLQNPVTPVTVTPAIPLTGAVQG